ncbi:MAG TPA: iron-containing alcohol dehydrogenase [Candidatus Acidoferrum sp.]|nr:iron-containing alcohol dehydrogenase [Candidatus Acidoferrum sp.]
MVSSFEFTTAGRILFGDGKVGEIGSIAKSLGDRALVVCGNNLSRAEPVMQFLRQSGCAVTNFAISGEPEIALVQRGAELAREKKCDVVVGIGGGSALDAAKAIAALATNTRDIFDYLEVIGKAQSLTAPPLPVIAVPTTAGTGSEVTRNAVLVSKEHRVKVSLRSPDMLPCVAIIDPELTRELPASLTASTGMDALTQLIEPFVSVRANSMTDSFCREAIPRATRALPRAFASGGDAEARRDMALASLFGGMALANAGLGAVHGFAAPIGGMFSVPHGAICASLLADVMEMNWCAAERSAGETIARYEEVARLLTGRSVARAQDGVALVRELCAALRIPRLREFGIQHQDLIGIAEKAAQSSSMKGNPVVLRHEELVEVLERAW